MEGASPVHVFVTDAMTIFAIISTVMTMARGPTVLDSQSSFPMYLLNPPNPAKKSKMTLKTARTVKTVIPRGENFPISERADMRVQTSTL